MNLFEHQSTFNPNMPLRGMEYFAELYGNYIKENGLNIYVNSLQKIPTPRYYVFYNGTEEQPDVMKFQTIQENLSGLRRCLILITDIIKNY